MMRVTRWKKQRMRKAYLKRENLTTYVHTPHTTMPFERTNVNTYDRELPRTRGLFRPRSIDNQVPRVEALDTRDKIIQVQEANDSPDSMKCKFKNFVVLWRTNDNWCLKLFYEGGFCYLQEEFEGSPMKRSTLYNSKERAKSHASAALYHRIVWKTFAPL
jgi:hypothetical protein